MTTEATLASFVETVDTDVDTHPLDDPVRQGLRGHHAQFARWAGRVARYDPTVAPFVGHPPRVGRRGLGEPTHTRRSWRHSRFARDLITARRKGGALWISSARCRWTDPHSKSPLIRRSNFSERATFPEILALIERTKPGPFLPRTVEMGSYYGIRVDGRLVAMAGERLHPPGMDGNQCGVH